MRFPLLALRSAGCLLALALFTAPLRAQCQVTQREELLPPGLPGDELYGLPVALGDDFAAIGAEASDAAGAGAGAVYLFQRGRTGFEFRAQLLASDAVAGDQLGAAVSLDSGVLCVGAPLVSAGGVRSGAAYVFRRHGSLWREEQKLLPVDPGSGDLFGLTVGISGDVAVVGAHLDDDRGVDSGSAEVFRFDGESWQEEQKLTARDGNTSDHFGISVAVSGDVIVVGAYVDDAAAASAGSAYVFRFDGTQWNQEQKLLPGDAHQGQQFGWAVAVDGDTAVIGARFDDTVGTLAGAAYAFHFDGARWVEEAKLLGSDTAADDRLGTSVAVSGDAAVVGARFDDDQGSNSGSVYAFRRVAGQWLEEQKLGATNGAPEDRLGQAVALHEDLALTGAHLHQQAGVPTGTAYAFDLRAPQWRAAAPGTLCAIPLAVPPASPLTLAASGGAPGSPGLLALTGIAPGGLPACVPLRLQAFAADGSWTYRAEPPPALAGLSLGVELVGIDASGQLFATRETWIAFL